jgi:hypothetical protein
MKATLMVVGIMEKDLVKAPWSGLIKRLLVDIGKKELDLGWER